MSTAPALPLVVHLTPAHVGQRLDRALVAALAELGQPCTRSALARTFAAGGVRAGGEVLAGSRVVRAPMTVEVVRAPPRPLDVAPEPVPLAIVYEDRRVLVVDKPAGMLVHPAPGARTGTLVAGVLHHLGVRPPVMPGNDDSRPGVVHRIDRDTSGLVVFAKDAGAQEHLARQFRAHTVERAYLAVGHGVPEWDARRVASRHGRDPADRRRFSPRAGSRRAVSHLRVRARFEAATAFEVRLETGRTHQVRMHARALGHPLVGDALYGRRRRGALDRLLGRQALHAAVLGFDRPGGAGFVRLVAPVPPDLARLLAALEPGFDPAAPPAWLRALLAPEATT